MARRKILSCALAALLGTSTVLGNVPVPASYLTEKAIAAVNETKTDSKEQEVDVEDKQVDADDYGLADNIQDGTILHCFDWKYNDIKEELPKIAEAGFTSVQTSPAQRDDSFGVWYMLYQPQSFSISKNALGSKEDLQSLCTEADKYGIKVIVDVVANHMRGDGTNVDDSMSRNSHPDYWHQNRLGEGGTVGKNGDKIDWNNRWQVHQGRIGMEDLNSEHSEVQAKIAAYIDELKSVGVDGIRWDAAKHIGLPSEDCQFWPKVTGQGLWHYGEILKGPSDAGEGKAEKGKMKEYTQYMSVTDNEYGKTLRDAFNSGQAPVSFGNWVTAGIDNDKLVYWGESHDTWSNNQDWGFSNEMSQNVIDRAYAIAASRNKISALYFSRPDSKEKEKIFSGKKGSTHYTSKEIAAVNHFHNAMIGQADYFVSSNNCAAVCRKKGAVIVKGSGSGQVSVQNGGGTTEPGTYTDEISGSTWTVTADTISGNIGDSGIAVIYAGEISTRPTTPTKTTNPGGNTSISVGANTIVAEKPSGWSDLYIYAYQPGTTATKLTGEWPGTKMTEGSDGKYTYTMDSSVTSAKVIFTEGASGSQDPQDVLGEACGFDYTGGKAYSYDGGSWSEVSISNGTEPTLTPTKQPTTEPTPTKTPDIEPTTKPTAEPTTEPTQKPEPTPAEEKEISVSVADKSSFDEETLNVKITLKGEENGTYTVDDGPERKFKSGDSVTLGEGKIADTDVTLKVKAGNKTETFTYKKVFNAEKAVMKTSAIARIRSLFEIVADVAETNAEAISGSPTTSYFSTNPNNQTGSKKTITSASDFTEDMIIAQGVANDNVTCFKGSHEGPVYDTYAMFGAYDDNNIYIGLQYVNVIDVIDPAQGYPMSDNGKPYCNGIPQMMVFDARTGDYTDGTANDTVQKTAWDLDIKFTGAAKVDHVYTYAAKPEDNNKALFPVTDGIVDYTKVMFSKEGTDSGITYTYEDGFFCSKMYGIKANGYDGYKPSDLNDESANWVDFLTTEHDTKRDSFMTMTIPMSALGVTADKVASEGIGVMSIATFGESGIGSLPQDLTMLDNVSEDYVSKKGDRDTSTSLEKADSDEVTVALAQLGGSYDGPARTTIPTQTDKPEKTDTPTKTDEPEKTDTPAKTDEPEKTDTPAKTDKPEKTDTPTKTDKPVSDKPSINFGADYSSPQYDSRELVLKAESKGNVSVKSYEFYVDNKKVQDASEKNSYKWKGEAGKHTIKVVAEYNSGKVSCEKNFEIYASGTTTVTDVPKTEEPRPTQTTDIKDTPIPTKDNPKQSPSPVVPTPTLKVTASPTKKPDEDKPTENKHNTDIRITFTKSNATVLSSAAGQKVTFYMGATGGAGGYRYRLEVLNASGQKVNLRLKNSSSKNYEKQATWITTKKGTYKIRVVVTDKDGYYNSRGVTYKITEPITIKTFKADKTTVKKGKKIKFTVKATSYESVKYRFKIQKIGSKTIRTLRGYSAQGTYTWKANAKGKYYVYLQVKDADDNTRQVKKKITVK